MEVPVFGDPTWIQKAAKLRCAECATLTSKPAECFFCGVFICPKCTRQELWGTQPRTVCKTCRQTERALDAEIKHELHVYEQQKGGK